MRQIETGYRNVMEYDYNDQLIHVVAGWTVNTDSWIFHVYVGPRRDQMRKVGGAGDAATMNEAFEMGFEAGRMFLNETAD